MENNEWTCLTCGTEYEDTPITTNECGEPTCKECLNTLKTELESGNLQHLGYAMQLTTSEETMMKVAYDLSTSGDSEICKLQEEIVKMVSVEKYNKWLDKHEATLY